MRRPFKGMAIALAAVVGTIAPPCGAASAELAVDQWNATQCEKNPHVTASLQICAFEREGVRYYFIDSRDGRKVRFAMAAGEVELFPMGAETVRVALLRRVLPPSGMVSMVYRDAAVEIDTVRDSRNQLVWLVSPLTSLGAGKSQYFCSGAGCTGNHNQAE